MLSLTSEQFSEKIETLLHKGKRHAALLYSQWMRSASVDPKKWAEPQALALADQILRHADLWLPEVSRIQEEGATKKFLLKFSDGLESETVVIPMQSGTTLCLSSQVGCKRGCAFCQTGRMGLIRNLTVQEIVAQAFIARHHIKAKARNIVFMGMGEPFDNYENVMQAIEVLSDPYGLGFALSRITVSTSGHAAAIRRFAKEAPAALNLAVSVNAPTDLIRGKIMPVNKEWDMAELKSAMKEYLENPRRKVLAEYVLIEGINDSLACADDLAAYLKELRVKINLIPYNAQTNARFSPPALERQEAFMQRLRAQGLQVLLRHHKGRGIMAACGQLGNVSHRTRLQSRDIPTFQPNLV